MLSLCALAATAVYAAEGEGETPPTGETEFPREVENYNNPDGMVDDVVENLYATGGDASNYGIFYVQGQDIIVKSDSNFANRNGQAYLWVAEGCSVTFLPASGVWNENFYGEGSGTILLDPNATMTIGSAEQAADLNNNNEAVVEMNDGSALIVYGNIYNRGSAQIGVVEGSTLEVMKEIVLDDTSSITATSTTIENSNGSLRFAGGTEKGALFSLDNSVLNTKSFYGNFWEGTSDSVLELKNSTVNVTENSESRWVINASGTSAMLFANDITETTDETTGETTTTVTYRTFNNYGKLNIEENSNLKIDAALSSNETSEIVLNMGSTLEVTGNLSINGTSTVTLNSATLENSNGELSFGGGSTKEVLLSLTDSVVNAKSISTGVFWEGRSNSKIELINSTINVKNDSTNWAIIDASGDSFLNFENVVDEESGTISFKQLYNNATLNVQADSNFKIDAALTNSEESTVDVNDGATLEVTGDIWLNMYTQFTATNATIKSGGNLYSAADASSVLNLSGSTLEAKSFTIGLYASDSVKTAVNLAASTLNIAGDSTNRGTMNVSETSSIVFGEDGRAFFNRQGGTVKISSNQSLNISRIREEGGDDSHFCNYGTIIVEAATDSSAGAAITVKNFVDDGNAGTIVIDFSNISDIYDENEYALISADALSVNSTLFQYTLDGSTFKDILLGDSVQDGGLFLELKQDGSTISYIYSFVPEPATYAAIFGALALALAALRRRAARN